MKGVKELGSVITNHAMTAEEICDFAGVDVARTEEDYMNMSENGKYDIDNLDFVAVKER